MSLGVGVIIEQPSKVAVGQVRTYHVQPCVHNIVMLVLTWRQYAYTTAFGSVSFVYVLAWVPNCMNIAIPCATLCLYRLQ